MNLQFYWITQKPNPVPLRTAALMLAMVANLAPATAQEGSISGRVVDSRGEPVADAIVRVLQPQRETRSSPDGSFHFNQLPAGELRIELDYGGSRSLHRIQSGSQEVELTVSSHAHSDEIVVSAGGQPRGESEIAQPINVLSGDELLEVLQASLGETLEQEPGVTASFFGPGSSRPVIRGLGGSRVRTLEDGIGSLDASTSSPDHAVSIEPGQAERIEVLRGPATLLYGSSAIGGVVNVIDDRIPRYRAAKPLSGTADLRLGSVAEEITGSVGLTGGAGDWAWSVGGLHRHTSPYEVPRGATLTGEETVGNSDLQSDSGRLGVTRFFSDKGWVGLSVSGIDSFYGIPGGDHEEALRIDLEQRRFDLKSELRNPFGRFASAKIRAGWVNYQHQELEGSEVGTQFFNDAWEARVELVQQTRGNLTGSIGIQARDRDFRAVGEEAFVPRIESTNLAVFAVEQWTKNRLIYEFGARYESQDTQTPALKAGRKFSGLSASAGLLVKLSKIWQTGGSVSRAVKMPTGEELFSNGPHFATQSFEVGNLYLTEEISLGTDLFLRRQGSRFSGELRLFHNQFDDFIFQSITGDVTDGLSLSLWSQADATFTGGELEGAVELVDDGKQHLDLEVTTDWVRGELDLGSDLPRIPPASVSLGLDYHRGAWGGHLRWREIADQDHIADNETATQGYSMINASMGYRWMSEAMVIDLLVRGRNLTDQVARNHISFLKNESPLPGRDLTMSLRLAF